MMSSELDSSAIERLVEWFCEKNQLNTNVLISDKEYEDLVSRMVGIGILSDQEAKEHLETRDKSRQRIVV